MILDDHFNITQLYLQPNQKDVENHTVTIFCMTRPVITKNHTLTNTPHIPKTITGREYLYVVVVVKKNN